MPTRADPHLRFNSDPGLLAGSYHGPAGLEGPADKLDAERRRRFSPLAALLVLTNTMKIHRRFSARLRRPFELRRIAVV